jgi:hypothetical protein
VICFHKEIVTVARFRALLIPFDADYYEKHIGARFCQNVQCDF